ncbi:hypothetical protein BDV28DRAFT_136598 [Aspergillus coremiiformis]|uniref:Secreted protein n=1 Tax=Aspergillus coremiiformis TaxID=138285 RepID=A0A5N6Z3N4_9EURO|nr:hypothetical protein BDV28DRAFT_136598 [Aspergillus coremiiformis]
MNTASSIVLCDAFFSLLFTVCSLGRNQLDWPGQVLRIVSCRHKCRTHRLIIRLLLATLPRREDSRWWSLIPDSYGRNMITISGCWRRLPRLRKLRGIC